MANPKALILTGYGINCEEETSYVFNHCGAEADIVHVNDLISGTKRLNDYQIMAFPGGFSYGDDTGSGNAFANKIKNNLSEELYSFAEKDKLIIGICNGFQILANIGLVPGFKGEYGKREVALMHNVTARYECRWVNLKMTSKKCVWTKGIDSIYLPIAHGEGNFFTKMPTLNRLRDNDQLVFKYIKPDGSPANLELPYNPNGALEDIAGISDESGKILGLMPHPERFCSFTNKNGWEKEKEKLIREGKEIPKEGAGLKLFKNAVEYFK